MKKDLFIFNVFLVVFSLLFLTQSPAIAGHGKIDGDFKEKWEKKIAKIHDELGLTQEQKDKLNANREKHHGKMEDLHKQVGVKKDQIKEELQKADFDINRVKQIHEELKALKAQSEDGRLEAILEARQVLTPEQFGKFMELKNKKWHHKEDKE